MGLQGVALAVRHSHYVEMINVIRALGLPRQGERGSRKFLMIELRDGAAFPVQFVEEFQFDAEERGLDAVEAARPADLVMDKRIVDPLAEIAVLDAFFKELFIRGRDHAAVPDPAEVLGRVKTETARVAKRAGHDLVPERPVGLAGVFDHFQFFALREVHERGHVRALSEKMNREHGLGPSADRLRGRFRVQIERRFLYVREDRRGTQMHHRKGRGCERKGRHDDLVPFFDAQRAQREDQRVRSGAHAEREFRADIGREFRLEVLERRAEDIGAAFQDLVKSLLGLDDELLMLA